MDGQLAQLITLVAHGSRFLSGSLPSETLDLQQSHSAFQYVGTLTFVRYQNRQAAQGTEIASDVRHWLETLRSEGATRLWYVAFAWRRDDLPEHIAVSFAGGVPRAIQVDFPHGYELWYPQWTVGDKDEPSRRIWRVEYRALRADHSQAMTPNVEAVQIDFRQKLEAAEAFAQSSEGAQSWAKVFTDARQLLTDAAPQPPYHADILPPDGYSLPARQLLAAAAQTDVFGGMGSWNDLGFSDKSVQAEYEQVTRELYEAVKLSFVAAVNSFDENLGF